MSLHNDLSSPDPRAPHSSKRAVDIDDILQDLDRPEQDFDPFNGEAHLGNSGYISRQLFSGEADLQALTRAWVNEKGAGELLPWPTDGLIDRVSNRIKRQIERVEELTGDMDPKSNFGLIIIQTEVERWKFLMRSYLRVRIAKIDKHTLHYLSIPSLLSRLSETEVAYTTRHQQLLHSHYLSSFLSSFPQQLQNLNDTAGGITMISGPDEDAGVFVRAVGRGTRENSAVVVRGKGRDADGEVEVRRGEVVVVRWSDVKELVESGDMELV